MTAIDPELVRMWASREWRLNNLYWIEDKHGNVIKFRLNPAQKELLDGLHYLNLILKARQLGFCYSPHMRILTADYRWVRIADLKQGDELLSVDEEIPGGRGRGRKMRRAIVEGIREVFEPAYRITMEDGRILEATGPHRHLCKRRGGTEAIWRAVDDLRVGDEIRYVATPWNAAEPTYDDGWFGGLLDGEGSMRLKPRGGFEITISQRAGEVLDRAKHYVETRGYKFRIDKDERVGGVSKLGRDPVYKIVLHRMSDAFRLLGETRPARFLNRPFWDGADLPGKRSGEAWSKVVSIEPLGSQRMIDLQTSTKTFICEGFVSHNSTFILLLALDCALFNDHFAAGLVADTADNAKNLLKRIKFAYKHLPEQIRRLVPVKTDNAFEMEFENGSAIATGVSLRSGTFNFLHISEYGKICAQYPAKANEIKSGALNTLAPRQLCFIESTAEGRGGDFYDKAQAAQRLTDAGKEPGDLDYKFHFFPWYKDAAYTLDGDLSELTPENVAYFNDLKDKHGVKLTNGQKLWYAAKQREQGDAMWKEFPSLPDEAFKAARDGAYFAKDLQALRQRKKIGKLEFESRTVVNTFWDIGMNDTMSIWLHQLISGKHRFVGYYENSGEGIGFYLDWLDKWRARHSARFGEHYGPHDIENRINSTAGGITSIKLIAAGLGYQLRTVQRTADKLNSIQAVRSKLPECEFDEVACDVGLAHLENYSKEWDDKFGVWKSYPRHDEHSHCADAFMTFADGYAPAVVSQEKFIPRKVV